MDKVSSSIKKISVDGVPVTNDSSSAISRNPSSVFAVVQHQPVVVRGDSGADILSGQEKNYVRRNPPSDISAYMKRYLDALKNRPAHPSRWVREEQAREAMRHARVTQVNE